jgi:hypothetical protein
MSLRRKSLEQKYLEELKKKKVEVEDSKVTSHILNKVCERCSDAIWPSLSFDAGKTWYCYGHRPDATEEDIAKQDEKITRHRERLQMGRNEAVLDTVRSKPARRATAYGPVEDDTLDRWTWAI